MSQINFIEVLTTNPVSVSTMNEITLYLNFYDKWNVWFDFIQKNISLHVCVREKYTLLSHIYKLPPKYELAIKRDTPQERYYYNLAYTGSSEEHKCSRKQILTNVQQLLRDMSTCKLQFKKALPEDKKSEYESLYNTTTSVLHDWINVAIRFFRSVPSLSELRDREQSGRRVHHSRRFKKTDISELLSVFKSLMEFHE